MTHTELAKRAAECKRLVDELCKALLNDAGDEVQDDQSLAFGALAACSTVLNMIVECALKAAVGEGELASQQVIDKLVTLGLLEPVEDET